MFKVCLVVSYSEKEKKNRTKKQEGEEEGCTIQSKNNKKEHF